MASSTMARVAAPPCPVCNSPKTRPSRRRRLTDWTRLLHGAEAWRCRCCRERFYVEADGSRVKPAAFQEAATPSGRRATWIRRCRRWWHNSYRWRLQHGRRLLRRALMVFSLSALVGLFFLFLLHYMGRAA